MMIQIRNMPDSLHRRLKSRAALAGLALSDCLPDEMRRRAQRPTIEELRAPAAAAAPGLRCRVATI